MRVFVRTRCWWTAAHSSSEGIGASCPSLSRSDSTMKRLPCRMTASTSWKISPQAPLEAVPATGHGVQARDPHAGEARLVAVVVDVQDLGQLVVVDHRERQDDLAAVRRGRLEDVALGADDAGQRGHDLLADGVQRRVRDLREELGEVVEDHARSRREDGDRRVGAHRADRLGSGAGHRLDDDAQLLLGVAEGLLPPRDGLRGVHDVLAVRQRPEVDQPGVQPLVVRLLGGELRLDLVVLDDPAGGRVDEEHQAGLQPALAHDRRRVDVEHTGLGAEHDEPVVGDPEPARSQPVAVEYGADLRAVGEADVRRAVPRLHEGGVELVEGPPRGVHRRVVLPGLGNHHQHRVRQRTTAEVEQLEHLVEGGGVAATGGADREQPRDVAVDDLRGEHRLSGLHPVAVAAHGVDLAVVRDVAVGVRERPRREGVRREARVHEGQRRGQPVVGQLGIEGLELAGREHALVHDGARRQRREVDPELVLDALAQGVDAAIQLEAGGLGLGRGHEQLPERRHDAARRGAHEARIGRHLAPAEDLDTLLIGDLGDAAADQVGRGRVRRQEAEADRVVACCREREVDDLPVERVGHLDQDARTVSAVRLGSRRATVLEVAQRGERLVHDVVGCLAGQGRDEGDAAGVVLMLAVVQALGTGMGGGGEHRLPFRRRPAASRGAARRPATWDRTPGGVRVPERDDVGPSCGSLPDDGLGGLGHPIGTAELGLPTGPGAGGDDEVHQGADADQDGRPDVHPQAQDPCSPRRSA